MSALVKLVGKVPGCLYGAVLLCLQVPAWCKQYSIGITISLVESSADNRVLAGAALHGLAMIFREGFKDKKAGIMLMDLQLDTQRQGILCDAGAGAGLNQCGRWLPSMR